MSELELEVRLFGTVALRRSGRIVRLDRRKAEALVAYVVTERGPHRRSDLAVLLWPEQPAARARAALRRTLFSLLEAAGTDWLDVTRDTVAVRRGETGSISSDVATFEHAMAQVQRHAHNEGRECASCARFLQIAVDVHRGDFLGRLTIRDAPDFDLWQHARTERFRESRAQALRALIRFSRRRGQRENALNSAREWVEQEPIDEAAQETLMQLLLETGRRSAAIRAYETFERRLANDLAIEPPHTMIAMLRDTSTGRESRKSFESVSNSAAPEGEGVAAWRHACRTLDLASIDRSVNALQSRLDRNGHYHRGIELLEEAFGVVDSGPLLGKLLSRQGALYACIGRLEKAKTLIAEGLRYAREHQSAEEIAYCLNRLGTVLFALGSYQQARGLLRESVRRYRGLAKDPELAWALNVFGHLSIGNGTSRRLLDEALRRARTSNQAQRLGSALNSLGKQYLVGGELEKAELHLSESLELRRQASHRIGIADTLHNLGLSLLRVGRREAAERAFEEALCIARDIDARPMLAEISLAMSKLSESRKRPEHAVELASAALHLPGGWRDSKERATASLQELSAQLPGPVYRDAAERGRRLENLI